MKSRLLLGAVLSLLFLAAESFAQHNKGITISGKVIDAATGQPLSYATVFLANTTLGTMTGKDGEYKIDHIPFGTYNAVFSFMGYEIQTKQFHSYKEKSFRFDVELNPKVINMNQVDVLAKSPDEWKRRLKVFIREFLGETDNAEQTSILNPEIIEFSGKGTTAFEAYSDSVIKIENKALGYMIYMLLEKFSYDSNKDVRWICYPRFEEMTPSSPDEKEKWEENRKNSFLGSQKHFFLSLINKSLSNESFKVYTANPLRMADASKKMKKDEMPFGFMLPDSALIVEPGVDEGTFDFRHETSLGKNCLNVVWYGKGAIRNSMIKFINDYTTLDCYGNILETSFLWETYGYWATLRIANLLPTTYICKEEK